MADAKKSSDVKAVVLVHLYAWHTTFGDTTSTVNEASKGDEITVSAEEFERGNKMTPMALAKKDSKEARRGLSSDTPTRASDLAELNDDELRAVLALRGVEGAEDLNRDELLGGVLGSPGGNERPQQP